MMHANNRQEPDSYTVHPLSAQHLQEKLTYLLQLSCFWLVLGSYIVPLCKQKISQALNPQ
ncbi:hypothetical protein JYB87_16725 [Shewanella avicenniae]|uniref:Uncharacterized protein n=1 Tax=Shewanella avicenniae TaxID=2814294 RepID=A0ABX7QPE4_9GAMM|nr:hypothetical protein [Shewanella avicenniae]QSX33342.1 hypothetical protein JYB87_16725 [Shewanella avicenniae]